MGVYWKVLSSLFQSTHSRGVRLISFAKFASLRAVSIHALTRSATSFKGFLFFFADSVSIHALTRSATKFYVIIMEYFRKFQSTHSRGVRLYIPGNSALNPCFNPRTHEECDLLHRQSSYSLSVSIHALTRSATGVYLIESG